MMPSSAAEDAVFPADDAMGGGGENPPRPVAPLQLAETAGAVFDQGSSSEPMPAGASSTAGAPSRAILQCFSGPASFAAAALRQGLMAYGVDFFRPKAAVAPVLQMDFASTKTQNLLFQWLERSKIAGVLFCIPSMSLSDDVIQFFLSFLAGCLQRAVPLVIEGHPGSGFWSALGESEVLAGLPHDLTFQWNDHKGAKTRIVSDIPEIRVASGTPVLPRQLGSRQAKEVSLAYPPAFATMLADVFSTATEARGICCRSAKIANRQLRASAMLQPRGVSPYPVVDEWKLVVYVLVPVHLGCDPFEGNKRLKEAWTVPPGVVLAPALKSLPVDSQLLSRAQSGGLISPQLQQTIQAMGEASILRVGIPWDPLEFIAQAGKKGHPFHQLSKSKPQLETLIQELVNKPDAVRSQRKSFIQKWSKRAVQLEPAEAELKTSMSEHRRKILGSKRILLFKEILQSIDYDDMGVVHELTTGATLTGEIPVTGVLDTKLKPARMHLEQLLNMADQVKSQIEARTVSSGDNVMDEQLWQKTLEEVEQGYLEGPFDFDTLPPDCLVSSRFPLIQGAKLRPIDNYSSSLINDTVSVSEKPVTHSIDEIALLITRLLKVARRKGLNRVFGKTADLKSAYRQLAISDESLKFSYLAVFDPTTKRAKLFRQLAVPFGSTKAVYCFLRVARALWTIMVVGAKVPTTNYFDDFVLVALESDRSSCSRTFHEVLKLLGWRLSDDKSTNWDTSFEALGVLFEIDQTGTGVLRITNTEKRRKELLESIQKILTLGQLPQKDALQLRGRLQFAQAQFFGRLGRRCLAEVTRHAYSGHKLLGPQSRQRLEEFCKFLSCAQPRLVGQVSCRTFMLLSDAAYDVETKSGGLGGVLLTGAGSALSFFSVPISEEQVQQLSACDEQTIIYELEMFGVLIALKLLAEETVAFADSYRQPGATAGVGVTCYIDNDAARFAFIAGNSKKGVAGILVDEANFIEYVHGILPWYSRVASPANLADEPSRMKLDRVRSLGFRDVSTQANVMVCGLIKKIVGVLHCHSNSVKTGGTDQAVDPMQM